MLSLKDIFVLDVKPNKASWSFSWRVSSQSLADSRNYLRGRKGIKAGIVLDILSGRQKPDFMRHDALYLISARTRALFAAHGFTGWKSYPVKLFDKHGERLAQDYFGLTIVGRAGPQDMKRGVKEVFRQKDGYVSVLRMEGLFFDPNKWDGSDFFLLDNADYVLVTRKVVNLLEEDRLTGWEVRAIADVRI